MQIVAILNFHVAKCPTKNRTDKRVCQSDLKMHRKGLYCLAIIRNLVYKSRIFLTSAANVTVQHVWNTIRWWTFVKSSPFICKDPAFKQIYSFSDTEFTLQNSETPTHFPITFHIATIFTTKIFKAQIQASALNLI